MSETSTCPQCGKARMPETAWPHSVCPTCLLEAGARHFERESHDESDPERIGPYRILGRIGEGGMGVVYRAEQEEPVRREVALKVIKRGMDSGQFIARFEAERQALALMDHPAIARVLDAGETDSGRPYLVMEYVEGIQITDHCDRHEFSLRERLELFRKVCEGVQHAHQKAVIHRDLKPSNVLVSVRDGQATPKIIDFGVAKALDQRLTEETLFTELGVMIGTPEYMSPEQAEMSARELDTRADVYSLGVMLFELLTGTLPFDPKELRQAGFDEIRRRIREDEPPRPSTRVSDFGEASTAAAEKRRTEPSRLASSLRGDLDWIVMKALEKDPERRYGSPSELAADVLRHLADKPVVAGPPSAAYRVRKFVRRHRAGVLAAAVLLLLLVGFAARESVNAVRTARERDRTARALEFLTEMFKLPDPSEARGKSIPVTEILERGLERIEEKLADEPRLRSELLYTIATVYVNMGNLETAGPLLDDALSIQSEVFGREHPSTLRTMNQLAWLRILQGRYDDAEPLYLEALEGRRRSFGRDHRDTLNTMAGLGNLYRLQGRGKEAETVLLEALELGRRALPDDDRTSWQIKGNLAALYSGLGRHEESAALLRDVFQTARRVHGEDHPDVLLAGSLLANVYRSQRQYEQAEALYQGIIASQRRVLGEDHLRTLVSAHGLALAYLKQGKYEAAETEFLNVLGGRRKVLGPEHPETLAVLMNLATVYRETSRPDLERSAVEQVLKARREAASAPGASASTKHRYAWMALTCDPADLREPEPALGVALEVNEMTDYSRPGYLDTLALAYSATGNTSKAVEFQKKAISLATDEDVQERMGKRLSEYQGELGKEVE